MGALSAWRDTLAVALELAGLLSICGGVGLATLVFGRRLRYGPFEPAYKSYRAHRATRPWEPLGSDSPPARRRWRQSTGLRSSGSGSKSTL